jgi:hypothetical protein
MIHVEITDYYEYCLWARIEKPKVEINWVSKLASKLVTETVIFEANICKMLASQFLSLSLSLSLFLFYTYTYILSLSYIYQVIFLKI